MPEAADGAARAVRANDELAESVLVESTLGGDGGVLARGPGENQAVARRSRWSSHSPDPWMTEPMLHQVSGLSSSAGRIASVSSTSSLNSSNSVAFEGESD